MLATVSKTLEVLLEWVVIALMVVLTAVVIVAVLARFSGNSFSWYDEVASVLLAWITYYGAGLAALKRKHIGFDGVLLALPERGRLAGAWVAEAITLSFFVLMAWAGLEVLAVLEGMSLTSLTWVPVQLTQSVIPIGAVLFIVGSLLSFPGYLDMVRRGESAEHAEIEAEIAEAERTFGTGRETGREKDI
ncbi:MAG: TRAP transporter small permease subunit [Pseudomonadota bacterium]